jgi:serine/threonine-protein kinase RsbW
MHAGAIKLTIESRVENAALVGVSVNRICLEAGFSEQSAFEVELCVVEAVNNAIEHAYRQRPGNEVEIQLKLTAQALNLKVADTGQALPAGMLSAEKLLPSHHEPGAGRRLSDGGRGLFIIRSMMDQVGYETVGGKNVLSMTRKLAACR